MMDDNIATETLTAYVPAGDRRLVLSAIDNQLNVAKESWRQKNSTTDKQPNNNNNSSREEFFMKCIDDTGKSLKQQIESVTVPADETEVERVLDSFQTRLLSTKPSSDCDDDDDDDESLSSVDDINEEIEFDDDEIVDQDAYNQVKQLRAQARDISSRIISIREETAGKALDMTRRDITELMKLHGFSENLADDTINDEEEEQEDNEGASTSSNNNNLNPMNVALQTLSASLQNVDTDLADKLESLKETIGTIDSSVEKYQRMSQGDESALSQTEKALLASDDEPRQRGGIDSAGDESEDSPMNPDKKLARLLAGVL